MTRPLTIGSWRKARGRGTGEVCARRLFFRLHLEEHRGCTRSVYARLRLRDTWRQRSSVFLNGNRLCFLSLLKYSFRRAMLQLEFRESKSKPKESHLHSRAVTETPEVCTVGGDDVWALTIQETRLSCRSTVAYFSSKVLSNYIRRAMLQLEFR